MEGVQEQDVAWWSATFLTALEKAEATPDPVH
jgi:hypothetical protein